MAFSLYSISAMEDWDIRKHSSALKGRCCAKQSSVPTHRAYPLLAKRRRAGCFFCEESETAVIRKTGLRYILPIVLLKKKKKKIYVNINASEYLPSTFFWKNKCCYFSSVFLMMSNWWVNCLPIPTELNRSASANTGSALWVKRSLFTAYRIPVLWQ